MKKVIYQVTVPEKLQKESQSSVIEQFVLNYKVNIEIEQNRKFKIFDLKDNEIFSFELKNYDKKIEEYELSIDSKIFFFSKVKVSEENSKIELFQSGFPNEMVILETIK